MFYTFPHVEGDKVLDDAYDRFYTSLDPKLRVAAWADIEKRVLDQAYMIKIGDIGRSAPSTTRRSRTSRPTICRVSGRVREIGRDGHGETAMSNEIAAQASGRRLDA